MGRGQVSVEYLIIVGIALGLLIPAVFLFMRYAESSSAAEEAARINDIGLESISAAKSAYALGRNARKTVEFAMPDSVVQVRVANGYELVFRYETEQGMSEAVFFSSLPLTVDDTSKDANVSIPHPGLTRYQFESQGTSVHVSEVIG